MPDTMKTYKNKKTGEVFRFKWSGTNEPTIEDVKRIKAARDNEINKESPQVSAFDKVSAKIAEVLGIGDEGPHSVPSSRIGDRDNFRGEEHPVIMGAAGASSYPSRMLRPEAMEQEDIEKLSPHSRLVRKGREIGSMLISPENLVTLPALATPAGPLVGAGFALEGAKHLKPALDRAVMEPSFESITDAGLLTAMTTAGSMGLRGSFRGKPTAENIKVEAPKQVGGGNQKLLGSGNSGSAGGGSVIDVDVIPREFEGYNPPQLGQGPLLLNPKRTMKGEGFTVNAPFVSNPVESSQYPIEVNHARTPIGSNTSKLGYRPNDRGLTSEPTGFTARGNKPITIENPFPVNRQEPVFSGIEEAAPVTQTPIQPKVAKPKTQIKVEEPIKQEPIIETKQPDIENTWLRDADTATLELMRKKAKGQLLKEIDSVFEERGYVAPKTTGTIKKEPVTSQKILDDNYNNSLGEIKFGTEAKQIPNFVDLIDSAKKGKEAGKSWEEVVSDLQDNGVNLVRAQRAAQRAFKEGEAGFFLFSGKSKNPNSGAEMKAGQPVSKESFRRDFSNFSIVATDLLMPNPDAIYKYGNGSMAGSELSRLMKLQRTKAGTISGAYDNALHQVGLRQERGHPEANITDEMFGNNRVKDMEGKEYTIIPKGRVGANENQFYKDGMIKAGYTEIGPQEGNVLDVVMNNAMPMNETVSNAAIRVKSVLDEIDSRAGRLGMDSGDIFTLLDETRDRATLFDYIRNRSSDIAPREVLGPNMQKGQIVQDLLNQAKAEGGDAELMTSHIDRILNDKMRDPHSKYHKEAYKVGAKIATATFLPLFSISNTIMGTGAMALRGNPARIMGNLIANLQLKNRMSPNKITSGAMNRYLTDELAGSSNLYNIKSSEAILRATAVDEGRAVVKEGIKYLKDNPDSYWAKPTYRNVKDLLLKNDEQMQEVIQSGKLTNKDLDTAGGRFAEVTQGLTDSVDLPYHWTTENYIGMNALMFKRMAYVGTKNFIDAIKINPTKAAPLGLLLGTVLPEISGDIKSGLKGAIASVFTDETMGNAVIREVERRGEFIRKWPPMQEHPLVARFLANQLENWSLGLISDFTMAAAESPEDVALAIAGPMLDLVGSAVQSAASSFIDIYRELSGEDRNTLENVLAHTSKITPAQIGGSIARSMEASRLE